MSAIQVRMADGKIFEESDWGIAMKWLVDPRGYKVSLNAPDASHRLVLYADGSWSYLTPENPMGRNTDPASR